MSGGLMLRHRLEITLDADPFWLSPLRATVTDLAIRVDLDVDAVADLTLAVDEACALLIREARPDDRLAARFDITTDRVAITVSLAGRRRPGRTVATTSFAWRVLRTLADDVRLTVEDDDAPVTIELAKSRIRPGAY
ncbi:MAG TPA: ATP-binding protein [Pseudonocardiaceae bacterium]